MNTLKRFLVFCAAMFCAMLAQAQQPTVVKWDIKVTAKSKNSFDLNITGKIEKGWQLYAVNKSNELLGFVVTSNDTAAVLSQVQIQSPITVIKDSVFENAAMQVYTNSFSAIQKISFTATVPPRLTLTLQYDVVSGNNFVPETFTVPLTLQEADTTQSTLNRILIPTIDLNNPVNDCGDRAATQASNASNKGLITLFFLGFIGGLVALLTPCVFPMIPLTVSFFTKKARTKKAGIANAFIYGLCIFLIYILLSLPFHFVDKLNPAILNNISTNVYLNVGFFIIFIVFAISFFGVFEITLPSSISNQTDSKAGAGNVVGIFFMALTLALVSFSCTGPILGSLLAGSLSADGGAMQLTAGMGGFGLALALPFALFALFPNWLNALPKSGGWLTSVKIVLGFIEVGLAFKFLSNADLVMHWGILKREFFIGIWIIVGTLLSLYLWNILKFKHDSPLKKMSSFRIGLAIIVTLFTAYLLPGVTNTAYANLKLISGFPPPLYYSIYNKGNLMVLDLTGSHDYEEGLKMAIAQNKPLLLDFTGYACVNCRRMEENVWSKPEIYDLMKNNFIVVSLYVDDKKKLPPSQQFMYTTKDGSQKEIITVGDKWATFETENFANNAQPWYAIISNTEQLLTRPVGYVPNADAYKSWLQCGLDAANKK